MTLPFELSPEEEEIAAERRAARAAKRAAIAARSSEVVNDDESVQVFKREWIEALEGDVEGIAVPSQGRPGVKVITWNVSFTTMKHINAGAYLSTRSWRRP
jgi:hypothetical protein